MTLFQAPRELHVALAKHPTAESKAKSLARKGVVMKWNCLRRQNRFFDALYDACESEWYRGG